MGLGYGVGVLDLKLSMYFQNIYSRTPIKFSNLASLT
jgi:hypothetical protein